jgi:Protein of unknown function (DUF2975)
MNEIAPKTNPRLNRIKTVSKVLRAILFAGLIVQTVGILAFVIIASLAAMSVGLRSHLAFQNCSALANLPFGFMVTLNFFRFFDRLKNGRLFDSQTVRYLEIAGKWWIILGIVQIILGVLEVYLFSSKNIIVSGNGIVAGLIIFFVAWLFREAQELQEEQELTV